MSRSRSRLVALLLCAGLGGCAAVDAVTHNNDDRTARLTVAVLPPIGLETQRSDGESDGESGLYAFAHPATWFQRELARELRRRGAATWVYDDVPDLAAAVARGADVFLQPEILRHAGVDSVGFVHAGRSDLWLPSLLLWAMVGPGSWWVKDTTYDVRFDVHIRIGDATRLQESFTQVNASVASVDTSHLSRNELFSLAILQGLVVPPFWAADDSATTAERLSRLAVARVADQLARFLRVDFEWQALQHGEGSMEVVQRAATVAVDPVSGDLVPAPPGLEVAARRRGGKVHWLSAVCVPLAQADSAWPTSEELAKLVRTQPGKVLVQAGTPEQSMEGSVFVARARYDLGGLEPGSYAVVLSATGDREFRRSLRITIPAR